MKTHKTHTLDAATVAAAFIGGMVALVAGAGAVLVVQSYGGEIAALIALAAYGVATFSGISVLARVTP